MHPTSFHPRLQELPPEGQMLLLRLATRRGPWFCLRALEYAELGSNPSAAADAAEQLHAAGLLLQASKRAQKFKSARISLGARHASELLSRGTP